MSIWYMLTILLDQKESPKSTSWVLALLLLQWKSMPLADYYCMQRSMLAGVANQMIPVNVITAIGSRVVDGQILLVVPCRTTT